MTQGFLLNAWTYVQGIGHSIQTSMTEQMTILSRENGLEKVSLPSSSSTGYCVKAKERFRLLQS